MKKQLIIAAMAISIMFAVSCGQSSSTSSTTNTDSVSVIVDSLSKIPMDSMAIDTLY
jgi:ABC-type phosphate/phosphonate transport system substrate-binding protein